MSRRTSRLAAALLGSIALSVLVSACDDADLVSAQTLIERARDERAEGKIQAAAIDLKAALSQEPDNAAAHFLLGQIYLDVSDGAAAEKELQRALDGGSDATTTSRLLAQAWMLSGNNEKVLDSIQVDASASSFARASALGVRGQALLNLGRLDEASAAFDEAFAIEAQSVDAMVGRARVALARGDLAEAETLLATAIEAAPNERSVTLVQGDVAFAKDDFAGSQAAYQRLVDANNLNIVNRLGLARAQVANGDLEGSVPTLTFILKRSPKNLLANMLRAQVALRQENYEDAIGYANKALGQDPRDPMSTFIIGVASYATENYEQSYASLRRFVEIVPNFAPANRLLAATQLRLNQPGEAAETLENLAINEAGDTALLTLAGLAKLQAGDLASGKTYLERAVASAPADADARTRLGVVRIATGETELGFEDLEAATELEPGSADPDLILIDSYMRSGEFDKAVAAAQELQRKRPDDPVGYIAEGVAYRSLGDGAKARAAFETALTKNPDHIGATFALAELDIVAGDFDAARKRYEDVLAKKGEHYQALMRLAALDLRLGDRNGMVGWLKRASDAYPDRVDPKAMLAQDLTLTGEPLKAIALLNELGPEHADNPVRLQTLGQAQIAAKQGSEALATMSRLVAVAPRSPEAHYLAAQAHMLVGDEAAAVELLRSAIALNPEYLVAHVALVRSLANTNRLDEARSHLASLQAVNPENADLYAQAGWLALKEGKPDEAVNAYRQALSRGKRRDFALDLASAQWQANDRQGSVDTLASWVTLTPEDVTVWMQLANYQGLLGLTDDASASYETVLGLAPNNWIALNNLADYKRKTDPVGALALAEKAYALAPGAPPVAMTMAQILGDKGELDRAGQILSRLADQQSGNSEILLRVALIYRDIGMPEPAITLLQDVLSNDPEFVRRDEVKSLLDDLGG